MRTEPLTLRESRTYFAVAATAGLTASAGVGAGAGLALGSTAGVVAGLLTAAATLGGGVAAIRAFVTCPRHG